MGTGAGKWIYLYLNFDSLGFVSLLAVFYSLPTFSVSPVIFLGVFFCRSLVVPFSFSLVVVVVAAGLDLLESVVSELDVARPSPWLSLYIGLSVGSEPDLAGAEASGAFVSAACGSGFLFVVVAPATAPQLAFIDVVPSAFAGVVQTVVSANAAKATVDAHKTGDCFISSSCMLRRYRP